MIAESQKIERERERERDESSSTNCGAMVTIPSLWANLDSIFLRQVVGLGLLHRLHKAKFDLEKLGHLK